MCTHGDVVDRVLDGLAAVGWPLPIALPRAKGSTWVLSPKAGRYIPPPA